MALGSAAGSSQSDFRLRNSSSLEHRPAGEAGMPFLPDSGDAGRDEDLGAADAGGARRPGHAREGVRRGTAGRAWHQFVEA